jgi:hypothetical protein
MRVDGREEGRVDKTEHLLHPPEFEGGCCCCGGNAGGGGIWKLVRLPLQLENARQWQGRGQGG